jgi:hypothetical protein
MAPLPDGRAIIFRAANSDQQVPVFRAGMTARDLMSMVEMKLESVAGHYFDTVDPEFDQLIGGAQLRR